MTPGSKLIWLVLTLMSLCLIIVATSLAVKAYFKRFLKKIEIKFQHLVEMRKVFAFFDARSLLKREKEIKDKLA